LGNINSFDAVYKQNFILALNLLTYWKLRDEEAEKIRKEEEKKLNKWNK